jgi:drug/metabolite transporter (DMT)-like permease
MRPADTARLVLLAAIWGASFLFNRITAPVLGPVLTAELRTLIAGVALAAYFALSGYDIEWRRWGRHYLVVGIFSSALPFLLWAYAALTVTAGVLSVLNATSPMWGALCAALLLRERMSMRRVVGLAVGIAGVALVTSPTGGTALHYPAVAAALAAAFSYGLIATYLRRWASAVPSRGMAAGSQFAAGILLIPLIPLSPPTVMPAPLIVASILALGLVCGAVAYLLYFRLIADIGATRALTVTYLIPVFGVLWGALFLGEALTLTMLGGGVLVIAGTVLVLRT